MIDKIRNFLLICGGVMVLSGCAAQQQVGPAYAEESPPFDMIVQNPYAATIVGTPLQARAHFEHIIEPTERTLTVFKDRKVPEGFWYSKKLEYGEMLQKKEAPLVYVVGGTGSGYKSRYTVTLANVMYSAGYHVILLPSPTHSNYIITASSNFVPGNSKVDAEDLHRVIEKIQARVTKKAKVSSTNITGYSLGGWHAAFVAELDSRTEGPTKIGFDRVLVINPPLSLYSSIDRIDDMLLEGLPNGVASLDAFIDQTLAKLSTIRNDSDAFDFGNEAALIEGFRKMQPTNAEMATTIGMVFRISAANMVFSADVMGKTGYIFPKNRPFRSTTPLNDTMALALRTGLSDYYRDVYMPFYMNGDTNEDGVVDENELIEQSSLETIRPFIAGNPKVGLITNRDDIVLAPGELAKLESLFAGNSYIFPHGGHLGSIQHRAFAWRVAEFFEREPSSQQGGN